MGFARVYYLWLTQRGVPVRLCRDECFSSFTRCPIDRADCRLLTLSRTTPGLLPSLHGGLDAVSYCTRNPKT